jgi:hypothetical protein
VNLRYVLPIMDILSYKVSTKRGQGQFPFRLLKLGPSERLIPCQRPTQRSFADERLRS